SGCRKWFDGDFRIEPGRVEPKAAHTHQKDREYCTALESGNWPGDRVHLRQGRPAGGLCNGFERGESAATNRPRGPCGLSIVVARRELHSIYMGRGGQFSGICRRRSDWAPIATDVARNE